ncbi:hypothetical protein WJX72_009814 [[Myrmecia] bisecta]|uniref:RRM domain-containing protein n=1 Tax=[Myrmecia] bisecta TaxID=41462 RepID=A0AAW1PQV8_9CHLO
MSGPRPAMSLPPPPQQMMAPPPGMPLPGPPPGAFMAVPRPMPVPQMSFPAPGPSYAPGPQGYPQPQVLVPQQPSYVPAYTNPNPSAAGASMAYYAAPQPYAPASQNMNDAATQEKLAGIKAALASQDKEKKPKPKAIPRMAAGEKWWDPTLVEWPDNDFRIFVGDLGNEVNDDILTKAFNKYVSFAKAKIVRDKRTNKSKGYGFVSLMDAVEGAKALREMNGKYIGNRPCKLRKSTWQERTPEQLLKGHKRKGEGGGGHQGKKPSILHK